MSIIRKKKRFNLGVNKLVTSSTGYIKPKFTQMTLSKSIKLVGGINY